MIWSYSDSFLLYIPLTLSYFELLLKNPSKENFYISCTLKPLEISKLGWAKCHVKQIQVEELGLCVGSLYLYPSLSLEKVYHFAQRIEQQALSLIMT